MIGLATALLVYLLANKLWSALDPDSLRYTVNNAFRALVIFGGQVAMLVLLLNVVVWSTPLIVGYVAAFVVLDILAGLAQK